MNHNAAFFNTAADNPPRILNLRLRPLQLGHLYLLHCVESPFVMDVERLPSLEDFMLAVFICSADFLDSEKNIKSFWLSFFFKAWLWTIRRRDLAAHFVRFNEYLETGEMMPKQKHELGVEDLESPGVWRLLAFLMSSLHMEFYSAMKLQVWRANALYAATAEMKHGVKLASQRDDDLWEFARREDAKLNEGRN